MQHHATSCNNSSKRCDFGAFFRVMSISPNFVTYPNITFYPSLQGRLFERSYGDSGCRPLHLFASPALARGVLALKYRYSLLLYLLISIHI